jgi:hypothetical protein
VYVDQAAASGEFSQSHFPDGLGTACRNDDLHARLLVRTIEREHGGVRMLIQRLREADSLRKLDSGHGQPFNQGRSPGRRRVRRRQGRQPALATVLMVLALAWFVRQI